VLPEPTALTSRRSGDLFSIDARHVDHRPHERNPRHPARDLRDIATGGANEVNVVFNCVFG
jgi:hypothetical protein